VKYAVVTSKAVAYPEAHRLEVSHGALVFFNEAGRIQLAFAQGSWATVREMEVDVPTQAVKAA
jgi:hypothetical protein